MKMMINLNHYLLAYNTSSKMCCSKTQKLHGIW